MKPEKKMALAQIVQDMLNTGIELGMAKQRHITAAEEEAQLGEMVAQMVNAFTQVLDIPATPKKDLH